MTFDLPLASGLAAVGLAALAVTSGLTRHGLGVIGFGVGAATVGVAVGASRRQSQLQSQEAALLRIEHERLRLEHDRAEVFAERNRVAREIHDVLAHSLGALSVQLEALDTQISNHDSEAAIQSAVQRTRGLVVAGLEEARRAIRALREEPPPLVTQLAELAAVDGAVLEVVGAPRSLAAEANVALFRAAQEACTNARKHAPGALISLQLDFRDGATVLTVSNRRTSAPPRPLATTGAGFGLTGMKERVELLGGRFSAAPTNTGWTVQVAVPN